MLVSFWHDLIPQHLNSCFVNGLLQIFLPTCSVLGKRLGKDMGTVAKTIKGMSQDDILAFEKSGEVTVSGHCLKLTDIKVNIYKFPLFVCFWVLLGICHNQSWKL